MISKDGVLMMDKPSMHVGVAGPMSLEMLRFHLPDGANLPRGYPFPLISHLILAYLNRGHRVTAFTTCPEIKTPIHIQGDKLELSITPRRPHRWWLDLQRKEIQGLKRAMGDHPVDVMHAQWTYEFALASELAGIPTLVTAHDSPYYTLRVAAFTRGFPLRLARALIAPRVIHHAQALTAVSPYLAEALRSSFHPSQPIHVIPNGVPSLPEFPPQKPGQTPRTTSQPPLCLAINQGFGPLKNTATLIEAWPLVRQRVPEARLAMLGWDHGPGEAAEAWALRRGLGAGIHFLGLRPYAEVQRMLKEEADLFVHPSLKESFSMVVLEAEAAGLAVVGGRCSGGVPYVMGEGQAGLLVDVRDPKSMAEGICRLLKDQELRSQTGMQARRLVEEQFTMDRVADQYLRLLSQVSQGCSRA